MKKKTIVLLVLSLLLSIFVSAQTTKTHVDKITTVEITKIVVWGGDNKVEKTCNCKVVFTEKKGEVLIINRDLNTTLVVQTGELLLNEAFDGSDEGTKVNITVVGFAALADNKYRIECTLAYRTLDHIMLSLSVSMDGNTVMYMFPHSKEIQK